MIIVTNDEGAAGVEAAAASLREGKAALDAVQAGIEPVEADPAIRSVGRGGLPTMLGIVECDAAIMDGATRMTGAVGALRGYLHAIAAARLVMERLPHVMLAGEGAARFAGEMGLEAAEMLTGEARAAHASWVRKRGLDDLVNGVAHAPLTSLAWPMPTSRTGGTVIYLAMDRHGHLSAGASTSGWAYKYPGRLGDSPLIGAGIYADDRCGACGCTHTGEMTIRCGTARSVVLLMKGGARVAEACHEAAADLGDLRGGFLGPVVIHAIDRHGEPYALAVNAPASIDFWLWTHDLEQPQRQSCAQARATQGDES
ncbi:isoaspartyl peptidase/L-asparaginase [Candidatus Fermentibacteria bacterium]|nr:isoaspartyl peptidase/L-asparaginase [Candidatus Fermentibacteria bacterium]